MPIGNLDARAQVENSIVRLDMNEFPIVDTATDIITQVDDHTTIYTIENPTVIVLDGIADQHFNAQNFSAGVAENQNVFRHVSVRFLEVPISIQREFHSSGSLPFFVQVGYWRRAFGGNWGLAEEATSSPPDHDIRFPSDEAQSERLRLLLERRNSVQAIETNPIETNGDSTLLVNQAILSDYLDLTEEVVDVNPSYEEQLEILRFLQEREANSVRSTDETNSDPVPHIDEMD